MYLKVNSSPSFFPTFTGKSCKFCIERLHHITHSIQLSPCTQPVFFFKEIPSFLRCKNDYVCNHADLRLLLCCLIPKANWGLAAQVSACSLTTLLPLPLRHDGSVYSRHVCRISCDLWAQDGVQQHALLLLVARVGTKSKDNDRASPVSSQRYLFFYCVCVCVCVMCVSTCPRCSSL